LRKEQNTFNRYLDSHPSVRDATVTTFQGIIRSVPLPSPAATPHVDDHHEQALLANIPEQILQREQLDNAGRAGLQESSALPKDFPTDKGGCDGGLDDGSCAQRPSQERSYAPELSDQGTPASTHPSHDSNLMHNPVAVGAEQVYHLSEPLHQIEVKIEEDAQDEQAGHDLPSATLSTSGGLESPPPTKPRALKRKRKSDSPHPDPLPAIITQKILGLASFETVVFLWDRL